MQILSISQLQTITKNYLQELQEAQRGQKTSLAFIKNVLPQLNLSPGETIQVMCMGGTIFEKALVQLEGNQLKIVKYVQGDLPTLENKQILLNFVKENLEEQVQKLALNFAYPLEPQLRNNFLDGKLIRGTKEHQFNGLVGSLVGEEIEKFLQPKTVQVSVANDTVCLVLAGLQVASWQHIVGGVVGTGLNFGLFLDKNIVVNLEAGNFNKFPQSESGKYIDEHSLNKGINTFEKEVAGGYLYQHFNFYVKKNNYAAPLLSSSKDLSTINITDEIKTLWQDVWHHSTALLACEIAGIYQFKQEKELSFVMDGSLFWKGYHYLELVKDYLSQLEVPYNSVTFQRVEKSSILGAAHLFHTD